VSDKLLREYIQIALNESSVSGDPYRATNGAVIPFGCDDCVVDLGDRLEDNTYQRDQCPVGTASRTHYNGVLSLLRKNLRRAKKINELENYPL